MKKLYIKQKVFSIGEKFTVVDEDQRLHYSVKGSFMKIPKTFSVENEQGKKSVELLRRQLVFCQNFLSRLMGKKRLRFPNS